MALYIALYHCPDCEKRWQKHWDKKFLDMGRYSYQCSCPKCGYYLVTPHTMEHAGFSEDA